MIQQTESDINTKYIRDVLTYIILRFGYEITTLSQGKYDTLRMIVILVM